MIGGLTVALGIVAMIMIHEAGHFFAAKAVGMKVTEFFFGFGPKLWSVRRGETEYGAKALPFGGYVKIVGMNPYEDVPPEDEGRTYREKPFWAKAVVVLAGIASHFLAAYLLFFLIFGVVGIRDPNRPLPEVGLVLTQLEDGSPSAAAQAGLQPGDRILAVAGRPVDEWDDLAEEVAERPGQVVSITVERDGRIEELTARLTSVERQDETIGFLGVQPRFAITRYGPVESAARSGGAVVESTRQSVVGLATLVQPGTVEHWVSAILTGGEVDVERRPMSPVGLVRVGAEAERLGFDLVLGLLAAVNVFVGVFNFVPLYPLDGGHFAVAVYERVTRRQVDVRKLMPLAAAVVFLFILLGMVAIYFDIVGPVPGLG